MKLSDDTLTTDRDDDSGETGDRDPATTDPEHYKVIFENDRVRVLEYKDQPGARTHWHGHPDSVMTLSSFRRRIAARGREVEVELSAGQVRWVGAQEHAGENIGDTEFALDLRRVEGGPPARIDDQRRRIGTQRKLIILASPCMMQ